MICRLCLNTLDEQNAVLLFASTDNEPNSDINKTIPENYLVQLISTHLYLCLSRDDAISTSICTDCCAQLESFHNFWKLVEQKQTTLCSQFLEIDCDVNWSEEGDAEQQQQQLLLQITGSIIDDEQDADPDLDPEASGYDIVKENEFHDSYLKVDSKTVAAHKFPCMFCEKSFKMRRYLEEHVATHTGDRPIACAYCNMAFRCRSNMYTHVKTKHNTQWKKARAERESAKINSNNNIQIQRSINGDNDKGTDALRVPAIKLEPSEHPQQQQQQQLPLQLSVTTAPIAYPPTAVNAPASCEIAPPSSIDMKDITIKSEPMEAINLTVAKKCATPPKRVARSRRKTHSPKKVQHTARNTSASEDSTNEDLIDLHEKRIKLDMQTCKENELIMANYNAVAAVVAAATQQSLCNSLLQQQHDQIVTAMSDIGTNPSTSTGTSSSRTSTTVAVVSTAVTSQSNIPVSTSVPAIISAPASLSAADAYTCSICGQQLRNQRALNNHLHNKHNAVPTPSSSSTMSSNCPSCGELLGQNHRCLGKSKYACDVCGKSFKMKRYLEEHFATHTGVKLHTCTFCPTEFRSKSNMYHHTKRKHKLEWERSRASRNAAKSGVSEPTTQLQPQPEHSHQEPHAEEPVINS